MRTKRLWCCVGMLAATSGCGVTKELFRYTCEQIEYHEITDECLTNARVCLLAASSWREYQQANPECKFSRDYAAGFKEGFSDYVNEGPISTPVIPPRYYWTICHQTPLGHERAEEWFQGFRAGVIAAEQSGYRSWATVPVALRHDYTADHDGP